MLPNQPFDIASLHQAYADGLSPLAIVDECFRRIDAVGDPGIFLHLTDKDQARGEASALGSFDPENKPLWGIPFAIKDNIDAVGAPTTAACPAYTYTAEADAFAVKCLRDAGAILIGKTNLDQFATGLVGVRTPYDIPKNAVDPAIVPGGSSSGSAVAVAHGIVSFALGTDTAGSGRVPAALNNIVGLKPTLGAISNSGLVPACQTLDTISVFALSVDDAYCAFRSAVRYDAADPYARKFTMPAMGAVAPKFRVGVPNAASLEFFGDQLQAQSFAAALDEIAAIGGEVIEIDFNPFFDVAQMLYSGVWVAERYAVIEDLLRDDPEAVHPVTRDVVKVAEQFNAVDTFRSFYKLQSLKRQVEPILSTLDMLCVPTIPTFYALEDLQADPIGPNSRFGTYTNFVNLLDMSGIAVPVKKRGDGRPGSITLLAKAGQDAAIAAVAGVLHQRSGETLGATGWPLPASKPAKVTADSGEIALAVVGAHMSGLPLNHELTRLGGRFLRTAKTSDAYQLYSLPGGPPVRPGLVQTGKGAEIEIEIWAMPINRFGEFIQGVPRPLGIGTLVLEDRSEVKGFVCEALAVTNAEDVTRFLGWRAYLNQQSVNSHQTKESNHA